MKSRKGFTLVELVVVIAIIGVLAAILIPSMLDYVRKSRLKAANTNAKIAYNGVAEFFASKEAEGVSRQDALDEYGNATIECNVPPSHTLTDAEKSVFEILSQNGISSGYVYVGAATINSMDSFFVQWAQQEPATTDTEAVFGQYPDPITWEFYKDNDMEWQTYMEQ